MMMCGIRRQAGEFTVWSVTYMSGAVCYVQAENAGRAEAIAERIRVDEGGRAPDKIVRIQRHVDFRRMVGESE